MIINIRDIAQKAQVSVSTVSRVLNNHPDVSEATRQQVKNEIDKFNFTPNANARTLKQRKTRNIAIIVKGINNALFQNMIETLEHHISKSGYISSLSFIDQYDDEVFEARRVADEKKPCGIIFLGANISNFHVKFDKIKVPCVIATTGAGNLSFFNLSSVSIDDFAASKMALDHLFDMGHRNILILGSDDSASSIAKLRFEGCMESFQNHEFAFDSNYLVQCGFDMKQAYESIKAALTRSTPFTAIFAMSDLLAIGAAKALTDSGLRVPEDVSVMGFDGINITQFYNPTLTTIKQPIKEIAEKTVEILMSNINTINNNYMSTEKQSMSPTHIIFHAELWLGQSVKRLEDIKHE